MASSFGSPIARATTTGDGSCCRASGGKYIQSEIIVKRLSRDLLWLPSLTTGFTDSRPLWLLGVTVEGFSPAHPDFEPHPRRPHLKTMPQIETTEVPFSSAGQRS